MNHTGQGKIVAFFHHNEICHAIVLQDLGEQYLVQSLGGNTQKLPVKRFILFSRQSFELRQETLQDFVNEIHSIADGLSAKLLPSLMDMASRSYQYDELCNLLGMDTDAGRFALYSMLRKYPQFYVIKGDIVHLRNLGETEQYLQKQANVQQNKEFLEQVKQFYEALANGSSFHISPEFRIELIDRLSSDLKEKANSDLMRLLHSCFGDKNREEEIRILRLALKDIHPHTDKATAASGLPVIFHKEFPAISTKPEGECSDLHIFSIDDEDTVDIDDAFSWEIIPTGYRLGIHITDLSRSIKPSDPAFIEARKRVSSLYLCSEDIPMLCPHYSYEFFSLKEQKQQPTLSLFVELDKDLQRQSSRFVLCNPLVAKNYSYSEADRLMRTQPFTDMQRLVRQLQRDRQGADEGNRFYQQLKLKNNKLQMKRIDNYGPSRSLVRELMILYNSSFAEYTRKHGIPAIYRNVEQFLRDSDDPDSAVIGASAYLSTRPDYHPGIGSEAYMHASSPIRRYTDLVNQFQVSRHLQSGTTYFDEKELNAMIPEIEKTLLLQREVINNSARYWFLLFLQEHHLNDALSAVVVKQIKHGFIAELRNWNRKVQVFSDVSCRIGDEVMLIPYKINADESWLKADVIS